MPQNSLRRLSRPCLAAMVCLGSALARGDAVTPEARELRAKEIAQKSESERARLQRSFKAFRDLTRAEQDWLRQFAQELKEDDRGGGQLRSVMNEYYEWLSTLTPGQRDDLRKETDPGRRDKRVRDLLKKQQELADASGAKSGSRAPRGFSTEDLDAVLTVVEQALVRFLAPEESDQLKKKHGLARHTYVLDLAFRPRGGAGPPVVQQWWSKEVLDAMVAAVTHPGQQHNLRNNPEKPPRVIILQLLVGGIKSEYESAYEKIQPDQGTLERFFVQLSSEQQDEIMRLPIDQQQKKLLETYMLHKSIEDPENFPQPPQFPWLRRMQQQAAQRVGGNRSGDFPRPADGETAPKDNARKKPANDKRKGKLNRPGSETE